MSLPNLKEKEVEVRYATGGSPCRGYVHDKISEKSVKVWQSLIHISKSQKWILHSLIVKMAKYAVLHVI